MSYSTSSLSLRKFLLLGAAGVCLWVLGSWNQTYAVNGLCGILDGGNYSIGNMPPGGNYDLLCDWGNESAITQNPTTWDWTCGDNLVDCSANISSAPNNGQCGTANGGLYSNGPPTTELCVIPIISPPNYKGGTPVPDDPPMVGGFYEWDCIGTNSPIATSTDDTYTDNPGTCVTGSDANYPNCDECREGTSYPNCRIHFKCRATYVAPTCGTQHGVGSYNAPIFEPTVTQTNLCNPGDHTSDGTTSTVTYNAGLDQYEWQCRGDGITDTANCVAPRMYDGVCGTANGGFYGSPPPAIERCDTSIGGDVNYNFDGNTYTWNCEGKNGGNNSVQCSATHILDGQCGTNHGSNFRTIGDIFTGDNCAEGTTTAITENADDFTWSCNSDSGGSDVDCSANKIQDGDCGLADGGAYATQPPVGDRCDVGNDINFTEVGDTYTWDCDGPFGGSDASCSADIQRDGACGPEGFDTSGPNDPTKSARELTDLFAPDLCDVGTATAPYENLAGTLYEWACNGINGGGNIGCGTNIIKDAVCDPASHEQDLYSEPISGARCDVGDESSVITNIDQFEWTCDGPFGGLDSNCNANIRIDGVCGDSDGENFRNPPGPDGAADDDLCAAGIDPGDTEPGTGAINPNVSNDGTTYSWTCMGQHNGTSEACTANITRDGSCDPASHGQHINGTPTDPDLCIVGLSSSVTYNPATLTYSWTCGGVFDGLATNCEAFESTDAVCGVAENGIYYELDVEGSPSMESAPDIDLCDPGDPLTINPNTGPDALDLSDDYFEWTCDGPYSGADIDCQATRKYNGVCGVADSSGIIYTVPPDQADLCNVGAPTLITRNVHKYEWTCGGINGGNISPLCDADHDGAIGSIQSDIDRANSYIGVNYTPPAGGGAATFTCFGQSNTSHRAYFNQTVLSGAVLNNAPPDLFNTDCLEQVGDYEFELFIIDHAGNESPQNGFYYITVLPGDIDPGNSGIVDCGDQLNFDPTDDTNPNTFPSLVANGIDACELKLLLRDSQGNEVTTIPADEILMHSPTTNDSFIPEPPGNDSVNNPWGDANVGTGFREGLRVHSNVNPTTSPKLTLSDSVLTANIVPDIDGDRSNGFDFHITAVAPSMLKLGHHAGAAAAGTLVLDFTVPDIDDFGQVDYTAPPIAISDSTPLFFYPMIRLQPNLMTYIDHLGNEQYAVFADSPISVDNDLSEYNNDDGASGRLVEIEDINAWLYTTLPESDTDPDVSTIDFDGADVNIQEVDTDVPPDGTTDTTRYGLGFGPQNALLNAFANPDSGQDNSSYTSALLVQEDPAGPPFENQVYTSSSGYEGQQVNLVTNVSYTLPDPAGGTVNISYPGGFVGSPASIGFDPDLLPSSSNIIGNDTLFYFRFVGASIEGGVIGTQERLSLSGTDLQDFEETYTTVLATGISANEARETMRAQAFEVINGRNPEVCGGGEIDFQSLIDSNAWDDEDVVYVEGCDVRIAEDPVGDPLSLTADELKRYNPTADSLATLIPTGQKTLVIKNGNLFIDNDLWYNDWIKDSFGFIVFNDDLDPYPQTGNVFIKHTIKRIVGTYYAEGGLFGSYGGTVDYNIFDPQEPDEEGPPADIGNTDDVPDVIANTGEGNNVATAEPGAQIKAFLQAQVEQYNRNQLILHGTLLSYNTLGGYHIWHSKIPIDGAPTNYFTAWNVMDDTDPDSENEAVSIQYDLHYLRRFNVHDFGTGEVCTDVVPNLGVCMHDLNAPDGSGPNGETDYVEDLEDLDVPPDGIPDGDGRADYTHGGFASARCTPDLNDILTDTTPVKCDPNPNAFVIRNDQKVSKYPPPGFGIVGRMDLSQDQ